MKGGPGEIAAEWPRELCDVALVVRDRVDSSQRLARSILDRFLAEEESPPVSLFVALEQTDGRGRRGRTWSSGFGAGLWASLLTPVPEDDLPSVPMRAAVALVESVRACAPGVGIKWPNDLVVERRKLGGVLVDAVRRGGQGPFVIVGFGINVRQERDELPVPEATSLRMVAAAGALPSLGRLAAECTIRLRERLASDREWLDDYRSMTVHEAGESIVCDLEGERVEGAFSGFDDRGFLVLRSAAGERTISSGEVCRW